MENMLSTLELKAEQEKIATMKNELVNQKQTILTGMTEDLEAVKFMEEKVSQLDIEHIKTMTEEYYNEHFIFNGEPIKFGKNFQTIKDVLIFTKEMEINSKKLDESMEGLEKEIAEGSKDLEDYISKAGDLANVIREELVKSYNESEDDMLKEERRKVLIAFDDGSTLNEFEKFLDDTLDEILYDRQYNLNTDSSTKSASVRRYIKNVTKKNMTRMPISDTHMISLMVKLESKIDPKYEIMNGFIMANMMEYLEGVSAKPRFRTRIVNAMMIQAKMKQLFSDTPQTDVIVFKESLMRILEKYYNRLYFYKPQPMCLDNAIEAYMKDLAESNPLNDKDLEYKGLLM